MMRLGFLLLCVVYVVHTLLYNFLNDDAYISFRYAQNLALHGELTYNLGERVEGYTNFLWTVLMALVLALGGEIEFWSKALGILAGVATFECLFRFFRDDLQKPVAGLLSILLLCISPSFSCWSTGGLEVMLFTFFLTGGAIALSRECLSEKAVRSTCWFALAALTRPEGLIAFGLAGLCLLIHWKKNGDRRLFRRGLMGAGWFIILYLPYFAWRVWYYGWLFPNTYYVKTGAEGLWNPGWRYVYDWIQTNVLWGLPLAFIVRWRSLPEASMWLKSISAVFVSVFVVHVARVGGDFMDMHRFLVPVLPLLALVAGCAFIELHERMLGVPQRKAISMIALVLLIVGGSVFAKSEADDALKVGSHGGVDSIGWLKMFAEQCKHAGLWLREHTSVDASIATTAAGTIPFYSRLYTVDILGLNDEWVAHNVPARGHRPGHTRVAPESYLASKSVDFLIYHPRYSEAPIRAGSRRLRGASGEQIQYRWQTHKVPNLSPPYFGFWQKSE